MAGHTDTKNVHASSVGSVGGDYSIANDTYTAASKEPKKPKQKKPKNDAPAAPEQTKPKSGDSADQYRPDWMPDPGNRNHKTQSEHP